MYASILDAEKINLTCEPERYTKILKQKTSSSKVKVGDNLKVLYLVSFLLQCATNEPVILKIII